MQTITNRVLNILVKKQVLGLKEAIALAKEQQNQWLMSIKQESMLLSHMTYSYSAHAKRKHAQ